jgi:hypothetical protein
LQDAQGGDQLLLEEGRAPALFGKITLMSPRRVPK